MNSIIKLFEVSSNRSKGFFLIIATYFIFSIMELIAKDLGQRYDPLFIVFTRYISQLIFLILLFNKDFSKFLKSDMPKLQLGRGALLMLTTCCMFAGLATLPFADHIAIYMIGPILTMILAIIFLKEKVSNKQIFLIIIGLVGAIVIANPGSKIFNLYIIFPFLAALFFALFTISTKYLNKNDNSSTTLIYTAISGSFLAIPFGIYFFEIPSFFDLCLMILMGVLVTLGHFFFIKSLTYINASVASPFVNITLILAAFWGYVIYNEVPENSTILGSILIVVSGYYLTKLKNISN